MPLAFFILLEMGLHLGGFGRDTGFFIPDEQPGVYRTNPRFTELFLPASFGLKPLNFRLPREKPAGHSRVFVVGESAAMGVPEPAFAIAPQLQAQLRATHPGRQIDVYNLGITAINSHAILRIVRQAVDFHPDLLVIYMGNNEVVGPYGPGSIANEGVLPWRLIRFGLWARSTRTGQLLQRLLGSLRPAAGDFKDWRGMEMFAGKTVGADDPRLTRVYANFAANLAAILATAHDAGVKVVLSTVAVNVRNCAPFASRPQPGLTPAQFAAWRQDMDQAKLAADLGKPELAQTLLERALALDPHRADTNFQLARVLDDRGEAAAARQHYLEALQQDTLRFRADARINDLIRHAAASTPGTVTLVDGAKELGSDAASIATPAGRELFFEHVHFRWEGNYALVRLLAPAAASSLFGGGDRPADWLDPAACAGAVGYTALSRAAMLRGMDELTNRPPFTGQSCYAEDRARFATEINEADTALAAPGVLSSAVGIVEAALQRDPRNPSLLFQTAAARLQSRNFAGALELHGRLATELPFSAEQAVQKAFLCQQLGRTSEAEELLLRSADAEPFYFQTYGFLARLWGSTGQTAKALGYFEKLVARMPGSRAVRSSYAQLLAHQGDWPAAERQWRAMLQLVPDDESALGPLIELLQRSNRADEAIQLMRAAYASNPRNLDNNARLVQVCEDKGDPTGMVTYMQALAASGPVNARLYADLARNLAKLGRREEMKAALGRARKAAEAEGDVATLQDIEELVRQQGQ